MTPNEKQPPPPSLEELRGLLHELSDRADRIASATATGASYMGRAVRLMEANETLSARERRQLSDAAERIEKGSALSQRVMAQTEQMLRRFAAEPSVTVVRDVPSAIEPEKSERRADDTGIFYVSGGALKKLRIPIRTKFALYVAIFVAVAFFIGGIFAGRAGVQPKTVVQYGVHALGVQ